MKLNYKRFLKKFGKILLIWIILVELLIIGSYFEIDKSILAGSLFIIGILSNAFTGLIALIAVVPIAGPLLATALSAPILWVVNGIGYLVSLVAVKKGYKRRVLNSRILSIVFLLGTVVGFIIGRLV
ncbi:MAG: hypothetical protein ABIA04_09535 [Pseudomonadota bacterium]